MVGVPVTWDGLAELSFRHTVTDFPILKFIGYKAKYWL